MRATRQGRHHWPLGIEIFEMLDREAQESSAAWNSAGTGHAALRELNYTPEQSDGTIDIAKALEINTQFDVSRQLWSYLIGKNALASPESFIHPVPHVTFVRGAEDIQFLKKRRARWSMVRGSVSTRTAGSSLSRTWSSAASIVVLLSAPAVASMSRSRDRRSR